MRKIDRLHCLKEACNKLDEYDLSELLNELPKGSIHINSVISILDEKLPKEYKNAFDMFTLEEFAMYLSETYNLPFREYTSYKSYKFEDIVKIK